MMTFFHDRLGSFCQFVRYAFVARFWLYVYRVSVAQNTETQERIKITK